MDHDAVLALFDREMRREVPPEGSGVRVERADDVVRQTGDWNAVVWSCLDEAGADAAIAAQVRHFTALGVEFEWKHYGHDRPADLAERLRAAGFVPEPAETLMVAPVAALPKEVRPPDGVRLAPVTDAAGVELLTRAHEEAFGEARPEMGRQLLDRLTREPDTVVAVVALAGDRPVSGGRIELTPGVAFAGLWGGGTAPAWRGRGVYRALVAYRARVAAERGYRYLQVDASDQSRPILGRLGFTPLTSTTPYIYRPRRS
ncbi:GNAT family N-acetyltransferase [Nonomuraea cavernae]|uniref:GNAT family N-acetyltransferase n=1 Tax=Nonomuraea cavernae TaxID=2045107 RepID=UPI00166B7192|nr:GNAT family N-acetyltransferase [Nonomuraea cavernae]MCA2184470.1 GNAT family N-acetyltransferase [Nonomuraea cavernae]